MTTIGKLTLCAIQLVASVALAAPTETKTLTLTRNVDNAAELQGVLTKNEDRREPYQAEYTVQIPYEDTETYYEQVPYTESVAYTDYEDYTDQEYQCRTIREDNRVCHTEQVCRPGRPERRCEMVNDCKGVSSAESKRRGGGGRDDDDDEDRGGGHGGGHGGGWGGNDGGGHGGPQCRPRMECTETPGQEECRDVQRCENNPTTRQECGWESVTRQRPVTRYSDETRYRDELRTRGVTRYREETRCCETRYRSVFDHQWTLPVTVRFPAEATLLAGETETFTVALDGTEAKPDLKFTVKDSVYGYNVLAKDVKPGTALVELALTPKFTAAQAGAGSVTGLTLDVAAGGKARLLFTDKIRHSRVQTTYRATIAEQATQQVLSVVEGISGAGGDVVLVPAEELPTDRPLTLKLEVRRQGVVLESGAVEFEAAGLYTGKLELNVQRDNARIGGLAVSGLGVDARFVFFDKAPTHADVKTVYKLSTSRKVNGKTVYFQEKTLDRAMLTVLDDGTYSLSFKDLGVAEATLKSVFVKGATVTLSLEVFRTGTKFSKISLWQGKTVTVE